MKYDGKFASRWRAKSPDALCAVLPLTNAAFWRIIKVKRGHTSRRSAPMLSYQEITVQVSSSGRLFPFMVMMIGKQNCCLNQCKYEPCKKTQLLPCYKILHIHHLPSIIKIMGAWKRPPTVIGMPSNLSIPYFDKNVKCRLLFSGKSKFQMQKRGQPPTCLSSLLYSTYFMPLVCQGIFCAVLPLIFF